jgi:hypothetical protein
VGRAVPLTGIASYPDSPVEVQACRVSPGGTGLLVTGVTADLVRRCRALVRFLDSCVPDLAAYQQLEKLPAPLATERQDLHVHTHGPHEPLRHAAYLGAAAVSLVALLLGRRPPEAVAVVGGVDEDGGLEPVSLSAAGLAQCGRVGTQRVTVHPESTL